MSFKDADLTQWCRKVVDNEQPWWFGDRAPFLKPHHIDILLSSPWCFDIETTIRNIGSLTPEQLEIGFQSGDWQTAGAAYSHPNATDAQKVKFLLKWGQNAKQHK